MDKACQRPARQTSHKAAWSDGSVCPVQAKIKVAPKIDMKAKGNRPSASVTLKDFTIKALIAVTEPAVNTAVPPVRIGSRNASVAVVAVLSNRQASAYTPADWAPNARRMVIGTIAR